MRSAGSVVRGAAQPGDPAAGARSASPTPRSPPPPPPDAAQRSPTPWRASAGRVVAVREERGMAGVYGIGMKVDMSPPHTVNAVNNLLDPAGRPIVGVIRVGDMLRGVDGVEVGRRSSMHPLESLIPGEHGTVTQLTLHSRETHTTYTVDVLRHVPITTWEANLKFRSLDESQRGKMLAVEGEVVDRLEAIRSIVMDPTQHLIDFLKRDRQEKVGLGLRFGAQDTSGQYKPCQVCEVIPGGAAWASGEVMVGDEVLAVDGKDVTPQTVSQALNNPRSVVGSRCELTLSRAGERQQVFLTRTSAPFETAASSMVSVLKELEFKSKDVKDKKISEGLCAAVARLRKQMLEHERMRIRSQALCAEKLRLAHTRVVDQIDTIESMLYRWPQNNDKDFLAESLKRRIADLEEAVAKKDAMCAEYKCTLENLLSKRDMELEELQDLRDARRHSSNVAPKSELDAAMDEIKLLKSDLERYRVQMKDLLPSSALEQAHQQLATCRQENEKMKMRLQDWPSRDEFEKLQTEFQMRAAELSRQRRKCAEMHCDRDELLALSSSNTKLVAESIRLKDAMAGMVKRSEVDAAQTQCAMLKATADGLRKKLSDDMVSRVMLTEARSAEARLEDVCRKQLLKLAELEQTIAELKRKHAQSIEIREFESARGELGLAQDQVAALKRDKAEKAETISKLREQRTALQQELDTKTAALLNMIPRAVQDENTVTIQRLQTSKSELQAEVETQKAQIHDLAKRNTQLQDECDGLKERIEGMVSVSEVEALSDQSQAFKRVSDERRKQLSEMQDTEADLLSQLAQLQEETDRLKLAQDYMVSRADRDAAIVQAKVASDKVEALTQELDIAVNSAMSQREELQKVTMEAEAYRGELAGKVDQSVYLTATTELENAQVLADRKTKEAAASNSEVQKLNAEVSELKDNFAALQQQLSQMVERDLFEETDAHAKAIETEAKLVKEQLEAKVQQIEDSSRLAEDLKRDNMDLQAKLASMVPLSDLQAEKAQVQINMDLIEAMEKDVDSKNSQIAMLEEKNAALRADVTKLQRELEEAVPNADLAACRQDLQRLQVVNSSFAAENNLLTDQMVDAQASLKSCVQELSEVKLKLIDVVPKVEFDNSVSQLRGSKVAMERQSIILKDTQERLKSLEERTKGMVDKSELVRVQEQLTATTTEHHSLLCLLAEAGLRNRDVLSSLVLALKGPPTINVEHAVQLLRALRGPPFWDSIEVINMLKRMGSGSEKTMCSEVLALLHECENTPQRRISEVTRIIGILNESPAMTEHEIRRLRVLLLGPPTLSLSELETLLENCGSLEHLTSLLAELEGLRKRCHSQKSQLEVCQNSMEVDQQAYAKSTAETEKLVANLCAMNEDLLTRVHQQKVPCAPVVDPQGGAVFHNKKFNIRVLTACTDNTLFVTTDGSEPELKNWTYSGPSPLKISLDTTCTVRAVSIGEDGVASSITSEVYTYEEPPERTGVGMLLEAGERGTFVQAISPAGAAGKDGSFQAGDRIVSVDGISLAGMQLPEIFQLMQGPNGSTVEIKAIREGKNGLQRQKSQNVEFTVVLTRCKLDPFNSETTKQNRHPKEKQPSPRSPAEATAGGPEPETNTREWHDLPASSQAAQPFTELVSYMTSDWRKSFRGSQRSVNNEGGSFRGSRRSVDSEGGLVEKREPSSSQIEGARNGVQGGGAAELIEKREPSSSQTEGPRNGVRGGCMAEGLSGDSNRPETRNSTSQPPVLLQESEAHSDDAFMESAEAGAIMRSGDDYLMAL